MVWLVLGSETCCIMLRPRNVQLHHQIKFFLLFILIYVLTLCSEGAGPEAGGREDGHVHGHGRRVEGLWVSTATQAPQLRGAGGRRGRKDGG